MALASVYASRNIVARRYGRALRAWTRRRRRLQRIPIPAGDVAGSYGFASPPPASVVGPAFRSERMRRKSPVAHSAGLAHFSARTVRSNRNLGCD